MNPFESRQDTRALLDGWAENLGQVLESMAGQRPQVTWKSASGAALEQGLGQDSGLLWWEEQFAFVPEALLWVASPRETWEHLATLTLKAAGIETSSPEETRSTWLEILGQWLSAFTRSLSEHLGSEVTSSSKAEAAPPENQREWISVTLQFGNTTLPPLTVAFSLALRQAMNAPAGPNEEAPLPATSESPREGSQGTVPVASRTMDLLLDVELPVSISFGKTLLPLKDVLKLTTGSIVELNRGAGDPVEILVNHCLVARGEVVVVEGNYGIRIQQIVSREDRLRSLH